MQYDEEYVIEYVRHDSFMGCDQEGTFGPYPTEEEGLSMMRKIQKGHSQVRDIHYAQLYRVSRVNLAGYARARTTS